MVECKSTVVLEYLLPPKSSMYEAECRPIMSYSDSPLQVDWQQNFQRLKASISPFKSKVLFTTDREKSSRNRLENRILCETSGPDSGKFLENGEIEVPRKKCKIWFTFLDDLRWFMPQIWCSKILSFVDPGYAEELSKMIWQTWYRILLACSTWEIRTKNSSS